MQGTEITLEGIFTTRKRAERAIDKLNATGVGRQFLVIQEFILDKIK